MTKKHLDLSDGKKESAIRRTDSYIPEILRRRLSRRQCVAYVGAGYSMACGMPNWGQLFDVLLQSARDANCRNLSEETVHAISTCERVLERGQFTMAASILKKLLSPTDLAEAVNSAFGNHVLAQTSPEKRKAMNNRLQQLVVGPWAGIVTTNYDTLIEKAIGEHVDREVVMVNEINPRLGHVLATTPRAGFFFVKAHGSISGSKLVLSTEEYDRVYLSSPRMSAFFSALFLRYFVVFIGCSLEDEVVRIRRKLSIDFEGVIPNAYALMPDTENNRMRAAWLRDSAGIDTIMYPTPKNKHTAVDKFLADAARCSDFATGEMAQQEFTRSELKQLKIGERLDKIGSVNRDLIYLVGSLPNYAIDHLDLVNLDRLENVEIQPRLFELTEEERVYRMLFMVSIGLLVERPQNNGSATYVLQDDVIEALQPTNDP